ncbi:MAG: hypothetical protein IRZ00_11295, partial [Gemmatimonadetes bacterium]|nr:hypothetical protein [Gemmatimonadota bacterium]
MRRFVMPRSVALALASLIITPAGAAAQRCGGAALNLGADCAGLSIGNSHRWRGLRLNWADRNVERVAGVNVTLWKPDFEHLSGRYDGVSLGLIPAGERLRGINVGVGGVVADGGITGLNVGGAAIVGNGGVRGVSVGGLALVANGPLRGVNLAGLATVAQGDARWVNVSGLATVANGGLRGINLAGLATVANGELRGIN